MKFNHTSNTYLSTVNSKGEVCAIYSGDEVNLKLDYNSPNLRDKKPIIEQYPDGWVPGIVSSIAVDGVIHLFQPKTCYSLALKPSDVIDVAGKPLKTGLKIKDIEHLLPRYSDDSGFDVKIVYKRGDRSLTFYPHELYRPDEHPEQKELEVVALRPGVLRFGGSYDETFTIVVDGGTDQIKIWVDDVRPAPEGYVWLKGTNEALRFIRQNRAVITEIALDHDAGQYQHCGGDYISILNELERLAHHPNKEWKDYWSKRCKEIVFSIHSSNAVGVQNMRKIIERNGWKEIK